METNETVQAEPQLTTRTVKDSEGHEFSFPFLVIDSPEKWKAAADFQTTKNIPNTNIALLIGGVSYTQYEKMEMEIPVPPRVAEKDPRYMARQIAAEKAILRRNVALIQISTGKPIPGEDEEERCTFLNSRGKSEVDGLLAMINDLGCCWNDNNQSTPLISHYKSIIEDQQGRISDSPFMNWVEAEKSQYSLLIQRPMESFITEFPLRGINGERNEEIIKKTDPGPPPQRMGKDKNQRPTGQWETDFNDPQWMARARNMERKKLMMYLDTVLPFSVPGDNEAEKSAWLGDRLVGDVLAVKRYIDLNITSYASQLSFF